MCFLLKFLELLAVLVPDFLTLGLVAPVFFSLCCIASTLGLPGTVDRDSALKLSLAFGYLVTIAINVVGCLLTPACSTIPASSLSESRVEPARPESRRILNTQPVGHERAVIKL